MEILVTSATWFELKPIVAAFTGKKPEGRSQHQVTYKGHKIDFLVSGIGLVHTAFHLTKALQKKNYDLVINTGIAGSFNKELKIGDVVLVGIEEFGDLGIESEEGFSSLFESGFINGDEFPFHEGKMTCKIPSVLSAANFRVVAGLTCNTAHGKQANIDKLAHKFNAEIESMEGAAFAFVCLMEKINFIQLRAISNFVESRDTTKWNIKLALENLSKELLRVIEGINGDVNGN